MAFISLTPMTELEAVNILLAAVGKLEVKLNHQGEHGFFLPHWKSFNSIEEYCEDFPSEQQCKKYDV